MENITRSRLTRRMFLGGTAGAALTAILAACGGEAATIAPTRPAATTAPTTGAAATTAPTTAAAATTAPTVAAATTAPTAAATQSPAATSTPAAAATTTTGSAAAGTTTVSGTAATTTPGFAEATAAASVGGSVKPPNLTGKISMKVLNIALVPGDDPGKFFEQYKDLLAYLKQSLGIDVKGAVGTSYSAVIEAQRAKKVDLGFYGPFSYILAAAETGAQCFLQGEDKDGKLAIYNTLFLVPADSPIKTLAEVKDKQFAFVDPASTSGFLVPASTIRQKTGLVEGKDYKFTYAGNHAAALQAIVNKKADMASVASDIFEQAIAEGAVDKNKVRMIDKSADIPGSPIAVSKDIAQADKDVLLQAFLSINDQPRDSNLYKNFVIKGGFGTTTDHLRKGDDKSYDELRKIPATLGIDIKGLVK